MEFMERSRYILLMRSIDKGIDGLLKKSGHGQSASTTEKISDGVRSMFKKVRYCSAGYRVYTRAAATLVW